MVDTNDDCDCVDDGCVVCRWLGFFNYLLPLTVGNGNMLVNNIVVYGYQNQLSTQLLIGSGFARIFLLGVSMNSAGFVGGFIFPTMTVAIIAGVVCYQQYSYLPLGLCIGCFLAGVPAGICPMPFTLCCLSIFLFFFGLYQTAPILIATITSYTVVCGSGLFSALQSRARQQEADARAADDKKDRDRGDNCREPLLHSSSSSSSSSGVTVTSVSTAHQGKEDSLSLAKYLSSKNGECIEEEKEEPDV